MGVGGPTFLWSLLLIRLALSPAVYSPSPRPGRLREEEEAEASGSFLLPIPHSLGPRFHCKLRVGQRHLFPEVKQILGYSWSFDFYILVNSERPEARGRACQRDLSPTHQPQNNPTHAGWSQVLKDLVLWEHGLQQSCPQAKEVTSLQALPEVDVVGVG